MTNFREAVVCGVGRVDGLDCGAVSGEMKNLCVVLVGTRNPLNVGAVARAMSNFGAMELRAVRPYEKAWKEAKSAVGAGELLARAKEFASLAEAVADCSLVVGTTAVGNREMKHPLRGLEEGSRLIGKRLETGGEKLRRMLRRGLVEAGGGGEGFYSEKATASSHYPLN